MFVIKIAYYLVSNASSENSVIKPRSGLENQLSDYISYAIYKGIDRRAGAKATATQLNFHIFLAENHPVRVFCPFYISLSAFFFLFFFGTVQKFDYSLFL